MGHFVYILFSPSRNRFYVGSSRHPEVRLTQHNDGWTHSTRSGILWEIVHTEEYQTKHETLKRERHIKRMKSRSYILRLIDLAEDREVSPARTDGG